MKRSYNTYGELTLWLKEKDWLFIKREAHQPDQDGDSASFSEIYLTPQGQEVKIYVNRGELQEVSTQIVNCEP